jgi:hypothetical protein
MFPWPLAGQERHLFRHPVAQVLHGRRAARLPDRVRMPPISRSSRPNLECHQAMSSVWTTADPAAAPRSRVASVVLPLELRPSTARTTGR